MRRLSGLTLAVSGLAALGVAALSPEVRLGVGHALGLVVDGDLAALRDYFRSFGLWAPLVSGLLIQVQAILAPIPAFPLMYVNGLVFGTLWGGLLSWVSILTSAILCFGLARIFGRPLVERLVSPSALVWVDGTLGRFGPFALFLGRLVPLTAFDLLSYAAGLTPMRLGSFCLATGLGMTPAIFLAAAAGTSGSARPAPWRPASWASPSWRDSSRSAGQGSAGWFASRPGSLSFRGRSSPRGAAARTAVTDGPAT